MTFDINAFNNVSSGGANGAKLWSYKSAADTLSTIAATDYFLPMRFALGLDDVLFVVGSDGTQIRNVTSAQNASSVTTALLLSGGLIDTADLADGAVTPDKLNASVAGAFIDGGAGTALTISSTVTRTVSVAVTSAQFKGMYDTPVELIPAAGANTLISVAFAAFELEYGLANYADGGSVALQYDSTASGGGVAASATIGKNTINGYSQDSVNAMRGDIDSGAATAIVNKGIYLSNATEAFTTGDSDVYLHITYSVVSTNV